MGTETLFEALIHELENALTRDHVVKAFLELTQAASY